MIFVYLQALYWRIDSNREVDSINQQN